MKKDPNLTEGNAKELKKPYEFLSKNERLTLGFLQDCPKQSAEIIAHLGSLGIEKKTAYNLLKRLERARRILRIKKAENRRIFYRINDLPENIDAWLQLLQLYKTTNPWEKLFIEKLDYNFKTLYPKYELKQILTATKLDLGLNFEKYIYDILSESIKKADISEFMKSLKTLPFPDVNKTD